MILKIELNIYLGEIEMEIKDERIKGRQSALRLALTIGKENKKLTEDDAKKISQIFGFPELEIGGESASCEYIKEWERTGAHQGGLDSDGTYYLEMNCHEPLEVIGELCRRGYVIKYSRVYHDVMELEDNERVELRF